MHIAVVDSAEHPSTDAVHIGSGGDGANGYGLEAKQFLIVLKVKHVTLTPASNPGIWKENSKYVTLVIMQK